MAVGLLPSDRYHYHGSRPSAPLWARCELRLLEEQSNDIAVFLARGLRPCPRCFRDKES